MPQPLSIPKSRSELDHLNEYLTEPDGNALDAIANDQDAQPISQQQNASPTSNGLSRTSSFGTSSSFQEDWEPFPPLDKLTVFDILGNLALPQYLERWQNTLTAQKEKVRKQQEKLKSTGIHAKQKVVGEWRRRVPSSDEQLEKYRKRMKDSVERLGARWNDTATVTAREKISFIAGVLNILICGYLIGAYPQSFFYWYSAQFFYFMPIRYYTYRKRGYHYFLADLCYFVNFLAVLSIWVFPSSKRLFLSTYCLAYGNNAIAIAFWRNSLVFHSFDKVTSLFIHIMPPVTLHCLVHMTPPEVLLRRFPAIYNIKFSEPGSPEHYTLFAMMIWASVPYAVWQLSYHFLITVRRREKIAAGRPTSFTWLRKSYAKTWIGKFVLNLPLQLQEPAFMLIQYVYALLTITPCPLWFWYRWASALFLMVVFSWSVYNGATFYIDVFGKRFQKELEQLKKDVAKWQSSPEGGSTSPVLAPESSGNGKPHSHDDMDIKEPDLLPEKSAVNRIPLLDAQHESSSVEANPSSGLHART
ncbi:hypothetical protein PAAG_00671 [Paracoccidioides lutzii Pb01]|uniref:Glycerophosphocholine acyltransferase 1 n=1 Tax=Paracoccidioides lutzii (strain ATCC MYA-826 / Pb01) TaxID=502779 RepID=C1GQ76_PARBA|nr:hypothetical protein PAAG_00671 [Paracoccidioides lutzii Pb01]EEH37750.1 hypothetical protein PAAG_00671 [Paracoccidioides lutzii Pb01]